MALSCNVDVHLWTLVLFPLSYHQTQEDGERNPCGTVVAGPASYQAAAVALTNLQV